MSHLSPIDESPQGQSVTEELVSMDHRSSADTFGGLDGGHADETAPICQRSPAPKVVEALRTITALDGLSDEEYTWLAVHGTERRAAPGMLLFCGGKPATEMMILLAGEVHVRRDSTSSMVFTGRAGQMTGMLPFSRMKNYGGNGYAASETWALEIPERLFPAMLQAIPSMTQRCVSVLLDRTREVTRLEQQSEKLIALGKLAGNLAHELNNPASAAQRTATLMRGDLRTYGFDAYQFGALGMGQELTSAFFGWVDSLGTARARRASEPKPGLLEAADREEAMLRWLRAHHIAEPWTIAPCLTEARIDTAHMDQLASLLPSKYLPAAVSVFNNAQRVEQQATTVLGSTERIFALIQAIKDYSYLDQAPVQDIDLRRSLDSTLAMFAQRLEGILVKTRIEPDLPPLSAFGSELNQVWTELIENAIEAMQNETFGAPCLDIEARRAGRMVYVDFTNNGPAIDAAQISRIFEPFFTTKAPGSGLGLGLDTAQRIVHRHAGDITVKSGPDKTCFEVRLPLDRAEAY
jgi:signal transduction histidine kinase